EQRRLATARASASARALFAKFDTDHNGQLSVDEFVRASNTQLPKVDSTAILNRLDANRDKKVTLVEYRTLTLTSFDRLDVDKDMILSPAEQRAGGFAR
ncbi:MAG: EF-hand domain-containing protein, partial [Sphingomicrobium sp.]